MQISGLKTPLALVGLSLCIVAAGCGHDDVEPLAAPTGPKVVPVTVATAARRTIDTTVDVVGTLKGWEDVKVGAEKSGRVVKVLHDVGDRVKPGEPLVELEAINADLAIRQAEQRLISELAKLGLHELPNADFDFSRLPAVRQAQAAADRAEQKYAREQHLAEKKVNTVESMQDAEFELRDKKAALDNALLSARATLAAAMASRVELDVARQAREDLVVRAPEPTKPPTGLTEPLEFAITKRMVSEGQMIREGEQVAQLIIDKPLRMWVNVPEKYTPYAGVGQQVRLTVASHPGRVFDGTVVWINPSVDAESRTFQVEVSIPNEDRALRPGGFVKASVITNRANERTIVPIEAIVRFAGVTKLFVVHDGKAQAVSVETGTEGEGWIEVQGEVPTDATVITSGQTQLADGTAVTIRHPDEQPAAEAARANQEHERSPSATKAG
ncbi:MAG TPA: efflux RND transporter periplasmic adaptor subunit [Pirellulales bacterium]|jgi:multidrug efflux pump subunit AcrA (membrane-fusion protein)